jgi:hypothetical protein
MIYHVIARIKSRMIAIEETWYKVYELSESGRP